MLIQKTFHLAMTAEAARARLTNFREYRLELSEVEKATKTDEGAVEFRFRLPCGFWGEVELEEVPGPNPVQTLFKSRRGNMEILGMIEFFAIKPDLTEVVLTIDYTLHPVIFRMIDAVFHQMDHFLNHQLEAVEHHFARQSYGIRADRNLPQQINGHEPSAEPGY